jgi:cardiolipin synthase
LHQKALLVDDELAAIGSFNMDYRSFRLNFELLVMVTDEGSPVRGPK